MKSLLALTITLVLAVPTLPAADTTNSPSIKISAAQAEKHFQETLTVTGTVAQVTLRERIVYLNLDQPFPKAPLTGVIFARSTNQFGDLSQLQGKPVEITGRIDDHGGQLQIILNSTNQLKVVEPPKPATP